MLIDFRELFPRYNIKPKGVLHIGANVGEEAPVYDKLGIKNMIFIEANPAIFLMLKSNIAKYPDATAYNYCIGDEEGKNVIFHVSNNGSQSSSILELGTHKQVHPEVHYVSDIPMKTRRVDHILNSEDLADYDFLNIDLQGAELLALRGMGDLLYAFKWLYLEVNQAELYKGCPHVNDLDLFLNGFGFKRVETKWCGNTNWGDALYIKK